MPRRDCNPSLFNPRLGLKSCVDIQMYLICIFFLHQHTTHTALASFTSHSYRKGAICSPYAVSSWYLYYILSLNCLVSAFNRRRQ
jgi:hypothetical protein